MNSVDGRYEYHHPNALGNNIVLTNDNQNVLVRYEYEVFGAIRNQTGTSDNTRKFAGKEFDADGIREVHTNTIEGIWTTVRNFLGPFRGVHKKWLAGYLAICEFRINCKRITTEFISKLVACTNF